MKTEQSDFEIGYRSDLQHGLVDKIMGIASYYKDRDKGGVEYHSSSVFLIRDVHKLNRLKRLDRMKDRELSNFILDEQRKKFKRVVKDREQTSGRILLLEEYLIKIGYFLRNSMHFEVTRRLEILQRDYKDELERLKEERNATQIERSNYFWCGKELIEERRAEIKNSLNFYENQVKEKKLELDNAKRVYKEFMRLLCLNGKSLTNNKI